MNALESILAPYPSLHNAFNALPDFEKRELYQTLSTMSQDHYQKMYEELLDEVTGEG